MASSRNKHSVSSPLQKPVPDSSKEGGEPAREIDYDLVLARLFRCAQEEYGQSKGVVERIVQEVKQLSQERVQIIPASGANQAALFTRDILAMPIQLGGRFYGNVVVAPDPSQDVEALYPLAKVQLIAQTCAIIFYALEAAAFLQVRGQQPANPPGPFTGREYEVMTLLCRGYEDQAIAETLHISRGTVRSFLERIYRRLDVHTRHDAIVAAFTMGLYSPIEHLLPRVSLPPPI